MAEIDDKELDTLRRAYKLMDDLYSDKEYGMAFKKMMKAKAPESRIPELDIVESVTKPYDDKIASLVEENKKLREEWENDRKSRKDKEEEVFVRATLDDVQRKYGLTDDGMQKVIARMKDKNNPDAEAAAAFVLSQQPKTKPATTSNYTPSDLNLYGSSTADEQYKELHEN